MDLAVAWLAVVVGAFVQGAAGFGFALVAAPLVALVEPDAVPVALLMIALGVNSFTLVRDRAAAEVRLAGWALLGSIPGSVAGALVVDAAGDRALDWWVAAIVLALVGLSVARPDFGATPRALGGAGLVSGFCGTVSSVGGPPVALALQHEPSRTARGTLAAYFLPSAVISIASLAAFGAVERQAVLFGVAAIPAAGLGFALSSPLVRHLDGRSIRPFVLALSAASAAALVARQII